jgi:hypothetical protein
VQLYNDTLTGTLLTLAANDHERSVMLAMQCMTFPGRALKKLQRIHRFDPNNKELTFLILREVNKLEDRLLTPELTRFGPAIEQWARWDDPPVTPRPVEVDLRYAQRLHAFVHEVLRTASRLDKAALELAAAHLCIMTGQVQDSEEHLARIDQRYLTAPMAQQLALERVLVQFTKDPQLSKPTQSAILQAVHLIEQNVGRLAGNDELLDQFHLFVAERAIQAGRVAEGIFLLARDKRAWGHLPIWNYCDAYQELIEKASPPDHDRMLALLDEPNKDPWEQYLTGALMDKEHNWMWGKFQGYPSIAIGSWTTRRCGTSNAIDYPKRWQFSSIYLTPIGPSIRTISSNAMIPSR